MVNGSVTFLQKQNVEQTFRTFSFDTTGTVACPEHGGLLLYEMQLFVKAYFEKFFGIALAI